MNFSEKFCGNSPFKNVEEPKKQDSQEPLYSEADWHRVASVTDAAIKKGAGAYIEVSKSDKDKEEDKKDAAPKMSPFEAGGYEGAADVVGAATYIPTAHMYQDMFNKIGTAAMDIEANMKNKKNKERQKEMAAKIGQIVEGKIYTKEMYDAEFSTKPKAYEKNKDGTFSLIT